MSLKIKIENATVLQQQVNGKNGAFTSRRQDGWIDLPNGERRCVRIRLPRDHGGYAVGEYTLGAGSFIVGQYGDLGLGTLELSPVPVARALPSGAGPLR